MEYKLSEVIDRFKPYGNENNDNLSFNLIDEENGTKTLHIKNVVFYDKDREGTVKADLVYIPFAGSGSEIMSCIINNRNWIATELNREYIDEIILPRINNL